MTDQIPANEQAFDKLISSIDSGFKQLHEDYQQREALLQKRYDHEIKLQHEKT